MMKTEITQLKSKIQQIKLKKLKTQKKPKKKKNQLAKSLFRQKK